jgi:hypothetical protein
MIVRSLHLSVAALGGLYQTPPPHRGLIEYLPDRHRPARRDDVEQSLDLGLGGAGPFSRSCSASVMLRPHNKEAPSQTLGKIR